VQIIDDGGRKTIFHCRTDGGLHRLHRPSVASCYFHRVAANAGTGEAPTGISFRLDGETFKSTDMTRHVEVFILLDHPP
jgi:hypothetical protein